MEFNHIKVVLGIILGLSITHLLKGAAKFIQHPGRYRIFPVHLLWVLYVFLLLIHLWWWEFKLTEVSLWTFETYFFVIIYIMTFYVLSALLFPDDVNDYSNDYRAYYFQMRKWFFSVLAFSFLLDTLDTLLKGRDYFNHLGIEYPLRNGIHILLCISLAIVKSPRYHIAMAILFLIYEIIYALRLYDTV